MNNLKTYRVRYRCKERVDGISWAPEMVIVAENMTQVVKKVMAHSNVEFIFDVELKDRELEVLIADNNKD